MGLMISDNGGAGDYQPVPEGTHIARCVRVIDLGMQPGSAKYPEPRHKVLLAWEIPDEPVKIDGEEKPGIIMARFTASLHKKSQLRSLLEAWRGRAFTDEELKGWSLSNILDVPCMLTVVHAESNGKVFANVKGIGKMPKTVPPMPRVSELICYSIEDGQNEVYLGLSEKLRATIDVGAGRTPQQQPTPSAPPPAVDTSRRNGQLAATIAAASAQPKPAQPEVWEDDASVPF